MGSGWIIYFSAFMLSLMALKKCSQGDNPEVLESHLLFLCAFMKFKNKINKEGNLKLFQKEKRK